MEHDHDRPPSFSAAEALNAPVEEFLCLACLPGGTGMDKPDYRAVVDAEKGRKVHETPMTGQLHPLARDTPMSSPQPTVARGLRRALAMAAALVAVAAALVGPARAQAAPTITEFTDGLTPNSSPSGIAAGPDGNLWFTELGGRIGRITPGPGR